MADEGPTEPLPPRNPNTNVAPVPPPPPPPAPPRSPPSASPATGPAAPKPAAAPLSAFAATSYQFTTGLRAGETATIRDSGGTVLLTYRSFASVVPVVAALVCGLVVLAGVAGALFLIEKDSFLLAAIAFVLTFAFATFIGLLVPRTNVTLYDDGNPALSISQRSAFPSATFVVATPNGATLATLHKSLLARFGRNRWTITQESRFLGDAMEESFAGAFVRKILGKFSRRFETNVRIQQGGVDVGAIIRRPDGERPVDLLELSSDAMDRRVAVALATLILGREP